MTKLLCAILGLCLIVSGCGWIKDKTYTPSEAEKKFITFCREEGKVDVVTHSVGKTLWIYLPLTDPVFEIKASDEDEKGKRRESALYLLSIEDEFDNRNFNFTYDIVPNVLSSEPTTYGSSYNETYTKKRQLIYQGLQESFFALAKDDKSEKEAPQFFVIIVADTVKGIATKNTVYLPDLKAYMTEALPFEEYYKRELNAIFGDKNLIGDKKGRSIDYYDVNWADFLTEQIKNRIKFAFSMSDFPPKKDPDQVVIALAANTLKLYPFHDFDGVYLYNKRQDKEMIFSKEQLKTYEETPAWQKDQGKLTIIHFEAPKIPGVEEKPSAKDAPLNKKL
ncbi:MAG: hypothetical protein HQL16_08250 [Candidatus Omnitrophica bacterium]|nr:hypothetical protein [Candidatus Omnitrophota bacterium]